MRGARSSAETQLRRTEAFADSVTDVISKGVLHFINLPLGEGGDSGSPRNKRKGGGVGAPAES